MSEYTTFYLRYKAAAVLEYKNSPSYEDVINLSESERKKFAQEINDHNDCVSESWGLNYYVFQRLRVANFP